MFHLQALIFLKNDKTPTKCTVYFLMFSAVVRHSPTCFDPSGSSSGKYPFVHKTAVKQLFYVQMDTSLKMTQKGQNM
jgi:hypothetical protein